MIQTITLKSKSRYGGRMPPVPIGNLLRQTPAVVQDAIRMALQGRSTARGPQPDWLKAMSDVRVMDVSGDHNTTVRFDAPRFGDVVGQLKQLEFWPTSRPDPEDNGFDLLGDILRDISAGDSNSDRFDGQLLKRLARFDNVLNGHFQEMLITGHRYPKEHPAVVDDQTIDTARQFYSTTPAPTRARVVGVLDMVWISAQSFGLELQGGAKIRGVLGGREIIQLKELLGEPVVVLGEAVFRASGNLLRINAETITPARDESLIWSRIPRPSEKTLDSRELRQRQGPRSGISAVIGRWPGEETDEQIGELLRELS